MTPALLLFVFLGFVVEATAGFGATVVTLTLSAQLMPVHQTLALFLPINLVLSAYLLIRYWRSVDLDLLLRRMLPAMGLGMLGGLGLYELRDQLAIKVIFGLLVLVLAVLELWRMRRGAVAPEPLPPWRARLALFGAGIIHGLFSCGGPLTVYVIGRENLNKGSFRATMSALWLILNVILELTYAADGLITAATLRQSALLLVPLGLGLLAGEALHHRMETERFRLGVFVLLALSSTTLLIRSVLETTRG